MARPFHLLIVLVVAVLTTVKCNNTEHHHNSSAEWDFLIFTQHWPVTVCHEWEEKNTNNSCTLPHPDQLWTIHGVWPTKVGTMGPQFCNKTWHFNVDQIRPIEPALNEVWINIEKGTPLDSLWAHEWSKHGTCAATIPSLGSEFLYFGQGLQWQRKYSMNIVLAAGYVFPSNRVLYKLSDIHKSVKHLLGVEPIIQCKLEQNFNYLFELRLCFNKNLDIIDCTGGNIVNVNGVDIQTNCKPDKPIFYPPSLPIEKPQIRGTKFYLQMYWLLSWIQWFTL